MNTKVFVKWCMEGITLSNVCIAFYIRLSMEDRNLNEEGKEESDSVQNQRDLLYHFVQSKEEFNHAKIETFIDDGFSGTNFQRPAIQRLLEKAKKKEVDCIVVKDLSRFGRNYVEVSDYLDQIFPFLGVRFISINDRYDSDEIKGKTSGIDVAFKNILYGYYSKDLSKKVQSGKMTKALKGDYLSPYAPFGYKKAEENKNRLVVESDTAKIVKRIFHMACLGMTSTEIANILNVEQVKTPSMYKKEQGIRRSWNVVGTQAIWDNPTIGRILRDERYLGKVIYGKRYRPKVGSTKTIKVPKENWIVVENTHEPLVTKEIFEKAQKVMKSYKEKEYQKGRYLFSGKLRCGVCGHLLRRNNKISARYYCGTKKMNQLSTCMSERIDEEKVEEVVFTIIKNYIKVFMEKEKYKKKNAVNEISKLKEQIEIYEKSLLQCKNRKSDCYDQYINERITREEYLQYRKSVVEKQEELEQTITQLEERILEEKKRQKEHSNAENLNDYLLVEHLTREMVEELIESVYVYHNYSIHIQWKFKAFQQLG